jgi:hypothetical protein
MRTDSTYDWREIGEQVTFCTGTMFMGINLPEMLNQQCLVRSLHQRRDAQE